MGKRWEGQKQQAGKRKNRERASSVSPQCFCTAEQVYIYIYIAKPSRSSCTPLAEPARKEVCLNYTAMRENLPGLRANHYISEDSTCVRGVCMLVGRGSDPRLTSVKKNNGICFISVCLVGCVFAWFCFVCFGVCVFVLLALLYREAVSRRSPDTLALWKCVNL